jgi:hypothetical protein
MGRVKIPACGSLSPFGMGGSEQTRGEGAGLEQVMWGCSLKGSNHKSVSTAPRQVGQPGKGCEGLESPWPAGQLGMQSHVWT